MTPNWWWIGARWISNSESSTDQISRQGNISYDEIHSIDLTYVSREQIASADVLSSLANIKKLGQNQSMIQETLAQPTIEVTVVLSLSEAEPEEM